MSIENRKQQRVILKQVITINNSIKAVGLDLSSGGLYIHTGRHFPLGAILSVSFYLHSNMINVQARVLHAKESIGMGLQFINLTDSQKQLIDKFVNASTEHPSVAAKKKVLIVDDNATTRRINLSKLTADGFSVEEAANGVEALALLSKENFRLVILDLNMELLDGYKVLAIMKQKPEWSKIPVLVFSAKSSPDEIDKVLDAGATEYLSKMTTSPAKLSERVKMHLSSK